jgi:Flp pilus assembly protein TadD
MLAPNEASVQIKLGAALLKYGDRNGGIAAFEKAAQLAPGMAMCNSKSVKFSR